MIRVILYGLSQFLIQLCISLSGHLYLSVSVSLCICLSMYLSVYWSLYVFVALCICLSMHLSLFPSVSMHLSLYICICIFTYLSLYASASMYLSLHVFEYAHYYTMNLHMDLEPSSPHFSVRLHRILDQSRNWPRQCTRNTQWHACNTTLEPAKSF